MPQTFVNFSISSFTRLCFQVHFTSCFWFRQQFIADLRLINSDCIMLLIKIQMITINITDMFLLHGDYGCLNWNSSLSTCKCFRNIFNDQVFVGLFRFFVRTSICFGQMHLRCLAGVIRHFSFKRLCWIWLSELSTVSLCLRFM